MMKNVEFSYPTRPDAAIFSDFTLTVPAGNYHCILRV